MAQIKVGIICNPLSQRNKKRRNPTARFSEHSSDVFAVELTHIDQVKSALGEFAERGVNLIVIDGGDGTVQKVMTDLVLTTHYEDLPQLAILPSGMTNLIAGDVGLRGSPSRSLARILRRLRGGQPLKTVTRSVMEVTYAPEVAPICAMFFGTAAIYRAIKVCREAVHPLRVEASAAVTLTLAGVLLRWIIRGGRDDDVFQPDHIQATFDDGDEDSGLQFLAMVTTLERLILRSRPFWGEGSGPLRYTRIAHPPVRLIRSLPRLLYGSETRHLPATAYESRKALSVSLQMTCPFTLDGELFSPVENHPVTIRGGPSIEFVLG